MTIEAKHLTWTILVVSMTLGAAAISGDQETTAGNDEGIPAGAIIGWLPPTEGAGLPPGWMVCSRANQIRHKWVPDLVTDGRFLRSAQNPYPGSDTYDGGQSGGSARHDHQMARRSLDYRRIERRSSGDKAASETHHHTLAPEQHLPPHVKVIFLCKCRSSDCNSG